MKIMVYILCFALSFSALAQNDNIFNQANDAYADTNYKEAKRLYQNILKDGQASSELYFNLGNTYYKLEDLANSIYYYEKALKLNPEDKSIQNNLAFAERMRLDQFERLPDSEVNKTFEDFIQTFSIDTWSIIGIVFLFVAALSFGVFLLFKRTFVKRLAFGICLGFMLLSAGAFAMAQTQLQQVKSSVYAIIFQEEKNLYEEPNTKSNALFQLHEGTKVKILDQFRSFYKIELPDGTLGWMTTDNIKKI
ncbi:tetratricopeptide repeat protein [Mesohalobacter halotolerans]|uniref:Tetratricopeptide repeat protein n=1 Tax=Mesohalobacter halotolerans TaxID=1883405 RepID=A0A4U5TSD5_9FLAO|nr:tetratricopeptide repeat protein [Mesohalobacter halotolerans]MBS3739093.1 tetratricopeptide repeat protein [Psychroflexus sp.]TKS57013.1 tetratricopeptide repeat protein [Mesohalobacter halotolerans]